MVLGMQGGEGSQYNKPHDVLAMCLNLKWHPNSIQHRYLHPLYRNMCVIGAYATVKLQAVTVTAGGPTSDRPQVLGRFGTRRASSLPTVHVETILHGKRLA